MPTGLHSPHRVEISSESKIIVLKYVVNSYGNNQSLKNQSLKTDILRHHITYKSHKNKN